MEASLETDGRARLRLLRHDSLDHHGAARLEDVVCGADGVVRSHQRDHMEPGDTSVCGAVRLARTGESQRGVTRLFPRDAQVNLPARGSAPRWQQRVAAQAAKMAWAAVANDLATETSGRLGTAQVEPIVCDAAQDCDAFDAQPCSPALQPHAQAQPMQGLTCDGKGGVMRPAAWRDATRQQAEARAQQAPRGGAPQDTSNRTRLATVAGLEPIDRHRRSAQTVARPFAPWRLVPTQRQAAPTPMGTKRWASLPKPRKAVMETAWAAGLRRDPEPQAAWGGVVDGDPTQIDSRAKAAKAHGVSVVMI